MLILLLLRNCEEKSGEKPRKGQGTRKSWIAQKGGRGNWLEWRPFSQGTSEEPEISFLDVLGDVILGEVLDNDGFKRSIIKIE